MLYFFAWKFIMNFCIIRTEMWDIETFLTFYITHFPNRRPIRLNVMDLVFHDPLFRK